MKVICIIPARLKSQRFPRKVLSLLGSKPLLQWVWEAATACKRFDEVLFAIDHPETAELITSFRGHYLMTPPECPSGTDRLVQLMQTRQAKGDIWVNWQGDEPFVNRQMIDDLLQSIQEGESDVWTLKKKLIDPREIESPNVVKVVSDLKGKALYFSRLPIPYARFENAVYYKHIGLYAFREKALQKIHHMPPSPLEQTEGLEQLRFLEEGLSIRVHETEYETLGIDTPADLQEAEKKIAAIRY